MMEASLITPPPPKNIKNNDTTRPKRVRHANSSDEKAAAMPSSSISPRRSRRKRPNPRNNNNNKKKSDSPKKQVVPVAAVVADLTTNEQEQYIAMDCEMVGVGPYGCHSALARVTLLDWNGNVVLDTLVRPQQDVTDYRTFVSGITADDFEKNDKGVMDFESCRQLVLSRIENKVVIGHALKNDFHALQIYDHPWFLQRDTAKYEPFLQKEQQQPADLAAYDGMSESSSSSSCGSSNSSFQSYNYYSVDSHYQQRPKARKLKDLVQEKLHRTIQPIGCVHDPVEDAMGALDLYKLVRTKWEKCMAYKVAKTNQIITEQQQQQYSRPQLQQQAESPSSSSLEDDSASSSSDFDEVAVVSEEESEGHGVLVQ